MLDQREIQKLGGMYAKYPSCYIIEQILKKYSLKIVLDATYGKGRFYACYKPVLLVGVDTHVWEWITFPDIFIPRAIQFALPTLRLLDVMFDVIVIDPPNWSGKRNYKRIEYNIGTSQDILESAIGVGRSLGIPYALIHFNEKLGLAEVETIEFKFITRKLKNGTSLFTLYKIN